MPIRLSRLMAGVTVSDFQRIVQVFPATLDADVLKQLDTCARRAGRPALFEAQTNLTDVRALLLDHLASASFRRCFIHHYGTAVTQMMAAVQERARHDDLRQFDLAAFVPGFAPATLAIG